MKKLIIISFSLFYCLQAFSQENHTKEMIHKIDSVVKSNNIQLGQVISVRFIGKKRTDNAPFYFDGPFLVLKNKYYNLDKLINFYVIEVHEERRIKFVFQRR